ncbi:hypothetical protein [Nonomuraea sp. NEAU-A123]|uniref:hypothetical protein n=1 Tax=Nonomuraea sp. NEAU-A123 TaxID=2839649 RepID=UPI001BE46407|nr:hypothetical protein [Nonomuraea sp. NEAU-A123]MBT2226260.1 hypothetical protein [Nonomuraea sp. NEAU-A123]
MIGACSTVTSDGFVSIAYASELKEGTEIEVVKANGALCVSDKACDEIKWINLTATFCNVDPDAFSLMTGNQTVLDHTGKAVGNRISKNVLCNGGFALEVWSDISGQDCSETARLYGYFLAPWVTNAVLTGFTLENDAASFELTARTKLGGGWDVGPYDVDPTAVPATPGPLLTPIGPNDHLDLHATTVAPPAPVCGCVALAA